MTAAHGGRFGGADLRDRRGGRKRPPIPGVEEARLQAAEHIARSRGEIGGEQRQLGAGGELRVVDGRISRLRLAECKFAFPRVGDESGGCRQIGCFREARAGGQSAHRVAESGQCAPRSADRGNRLLSCFGRCHGAGRICGVPDCGGVKLGLEVAEAIRHIQIGADAFEQRFDLLNGRDLAGICERLPDGRGVELRDEVAQLGDGGESRADIVEQRFDLFDGRDFAGICERLPDGRGVELGDEVAQLGDGGESRADIVKQRLSLVLRRHRAGTLDALPSIVTGELCAGAPQLAER